MRTVVALADRVALLGERAARRSGQLPLGQRPTRAEAVLDLAFRVRLMQITGGHVDLFSLRWGDSGVDGVLVREDQPPSSA